MGPYYVYHITPTHPRFTPPHRLPLGFIYLPHTPLPTRFPWFPYTVVTHYGMVCAVPSPHFTTHTRTFPVAVPHLLHAARRHGLALTPTPHPQFCGRSLLLHTHHPTYRRTTFLPFACHLLALLPTTACVLPHYIPLPHIHDISVGCYARALRSSCRLGKHRTHAPHHIPAGSTPPTCYTPPRTVAHHAHARHFPDLPPPYLPHPRTPTPRFAIWVLRLPVLVPVLHSQYADGAAGWFVTAVWLRDGWDPQRCHAVLYRATTCSCTGCRCVGHQHLPRCGGPSRSAPYRQKLPPNPTARLGTPPACQNTLPGGAANA